MTLTNGLLQLLNQRNQCSNSLLQPRYSIQAVLKGSLLKSRKTLKFYNMSLEDLVFVSPTIDLLVGRLPLFGEDMVVLHHCLFNLVGCSQDLLSVLLCICFNLPNLSAMGIPLPLCIIHLEEKD